MFNIERQRAYGLAGIGVVTLLLGFVADPGFGQFLFCTYLFLTAFGYLMFFFYAIADEENLYHALVGIIFCALFIVLGLIGINYVPALMSGVLFR